MMLFVRVLCLLLLMNTWAEAREQLKLNWSTYHFTGDYGRVTGIETETLVNQLSVNYQRPQWQLGFSQAYLSQTGPRTLLIDEYVDEDGFLIREFIERNEERRGLGDPNIKFSYQWPKQTSYYRQSGGLWRASGRWKIPLADDENGFSNGRHEWFAAIQRSQRFDQLSLSMTLGRHWRTHKQDAANNARNYIRLSTMFFPERRIGIGASFYAKQASTGSVDDVRSGSLNGYWRINRDWSLSGSVGKGFSDVVSDQVFGLNLSHRWRL
ncbi:hypothetical protein [Bacterioplanoides sp. SCSIO 12839]|uniref:hypothetical protein n=1 Tax=Bacterioplanoides sp. SCSIO 12839 TaxID=2829569 RepID=UPI002103852D|nr:hypothetical protein [Bacterioplanoides sp. SCSIO 12839]UTW48407.1 hypothetical protein KFF03_00415 [Bacterioplanoides sp. SCSIO 12839]